MAPPWGIILALGGEYYWPSTRTTNNAGIPIAGKKLGAIPNKYLTVMLSPL
jgi:hypothetical protein